MVQMNEAVKSFLFGYFSTCRRSPKTQAAYRMDLSQFETFVGGSEALGAIQVGVVERWATELTSKGYAPVSVRRKFATLKVFFGYWVRKGDLDASPLWRIRLDLARESRLPRSLTPADAKVILERAWSHVQTTPATIRRASDEFFLALRNLASIELLFATGMRVGELVSLNLGDWRGDDKNLLVNGKGSRQRLAVLPDDRSVRAFENYLVARTAMHLGHDALLGVCPRNSSWPLKQIRPIMLHGKDVPTLPTGSGVAAASQSARLVA